MEKEALRHLGLEIYQIYRLDQPTARLTNHPLSPMHHHESHHEYHHQNKFFHSMVHEAISRGRFDFIMTLKINTKQQHHSLAWQVSAVLACSNLHICS